MSEKKRISKKLEAVKTVLLLLCALLLFLGVIQLDNLEHHILSLERRMDAIESKSLNKSDTLQKLNSYNRKWIHPEIPNALEPEHSDIKARSAQQGGTLTRWLGPEPKGLNPILELDGSAKKVTEQYIYERLADYHFNNPDKLAPRLAERVEITDDYKEYTIYLKRGVKWHQPALDLSNPKYKWLFQADRELTADDICFTIDTVLNPQVQSGHWRSYYTDVESCRVLGRYTAIIKWKKKTYNSIDFTLGLQPIPKFLFSRDQQGAAFLPAEFGRNFNEHWYNQKAIGTGPYKLDSWERGRSIKLVRNPEYHGEAPAIDNIIWRVGSDSENVVLKLKAGEVDIANLRPVDYAEEILGAEPDSPFKDGRIEHGFYDQLVYSYIGWNQANPIFADPRVRRAMTMSLDRNSILKNIFYGLGEIITGPFYYRSPYSDPDIKPIPFDIDGAKKLLAEAGWTDRDGDGALEKTINGKKTAFEFTLLMTAGYSHWRDMAAFFKESLYKIGVGMKVAEVDWSTFQKLRDERKFDAFLGFWGLYWFTDPYEIWHSSQSDLTASSNYVGYRNTQTDLLIERLRETFDLRTRVELCRAIHRSIHEDQPYTFLFTNRTAASWNSRVKDVEFRPIFPFDLSLGWYLDK